MPAEQTQLSHSSDPELSASGHSFSQSLYDLEIVKK